MGTERYQIIIAYDGTDYFGFQRQKNRRTVQGEIETALIKLGWHGKSILGAGRTDTGVHASGQVVAFELEWSHQPVDLRNALNANLPSDIAVQDVCVAASDFHPRFDAKYRIYEYTLFSSDIRDPLRERYTWRINENLDEKLLKNAASILPGCHDFKAFGKSQTKEGTTIRSIYKADWYSKKESCVSVEWRFYIMANAFLYHMVRRLVFVQVLISQGRLDFSEMEEALERGKVLINGLAPARGLRLVKVGYEAITSK